MNLIKDLSFSFRLLPRRLPRLLITSFFVALLLLPGLFFALSLDAIIPALDLNLGSSSPVVLLSGDTSSLSSADLDSAGATNLGSALVLNGLPFLPSTFVPSALDPSSASTEAVLEPVLLGDTSLDPNLPTYGTFDRVITPLYAYYLINYISSSETPALEESKDLASGRSFLPLTEFSPDLKAQISSLIGKTFTERISLALPAEPTTLLESPEEGLIVEDADENLADTSEPEPSSEDTSSTLADTTSEDSVIAEPTLVEPTETLPEKAVDFYVTYRVAGIASVYNRPTPDFKAYERALETDFSKPQTILPGQLDLEAAFARGVFLNYPSTQLSDFTASALRTEELPIISFKDVSALARFWRYFTVTSLASGINTNGIFLGELNTLTLPSLGLILISLLFLLIYFLFFGLLVFLLFNSAKKSFARRNAKTFALLHAVRATEFDARLICAPFRLLLLLASFAWLVLAVYLVSPELLNFISRLLSSSFATLFFWSATANVSLSFGFFTAVFVGLLVLIWLLSGLRTRSFTSMSKISKYIEN